MARSADKDTWDQHDWRDAINEIVEQKLAENPKWKDEILATLIHREAASQVGRALSDIAYQERCARHVKQNEDRSKTIVNKIMELLGQLK